MGYHFNPAKTHKHYFKNKMRAREFAQKEVS